MNMNLISERRGLFFESLSRIRVINTAALRNMRDKIPRTSIAESAAAAAA